MTNLTQKQKRILLGVASAILFGMVGALIYKPQSYEEYIVKKRGTSQKTEQKTIPGPQTAVEGFLNLALSNKPTEAVAFLENPDTNISSVDSIMKFLDVEIPLKFDYTIKDVTFNASTGMVAVDLVTSAGRLEKEISLKSVDGQWKLSGVTSRNNNQFVFSDTDGTITMLLPQNMLSENTTTDVGNAFTIHNAEGTIQIVLFVTDEDSTELFSQMTDCTTGNCSKKNINGVAFDVFEVNDPTSNEYAYTAEAQKDGVFFTIIGVAKSADDRETIKKIVDTVRI